MQNKGIVICTAVLLTLASIFYLSFSAATRYFDSQAAKIQDPILFLSEVLGDSDWSGS